MALLGFYDGAIGCLIIHVEVETFVSHCWNEPFQHFVATLGTIRLNTGVWVCSFAMPQSLGLPSWFQALHKLHESLLVCGLFQ